MSAQILQFPMPAHRACSIERSNCLGSGAAVPIELAHLKAQRAERAAFNEILTFVRVLNPGVSRDIARERARIIKETCGLFDKLVAKHAKLLA